MVLCHGMQGIYILFNHKQMFLRPGCQETLNQGVQICCHKSEINALLWWLQGHTLSHLFCCLIPVRERMDVCLELLLDRFSVCPAANAAFSVELWFGRCCWCFRPLACVSRAFLPWPTPENDFEQTLHFAESVSASFWTQSLYWSSVNHISWKDILYLFLTSESNQQNIMALTS